MKDLYTPSMPPWVAAGLGLFSLLSISASAADETWDGTTDGTWNTNSNWVSDSGVPGTGDTATFNGAGNGNTTLDLGPGISVNVISFETGAASYTLGTGGTGSQTITLDDGGSITVSVGADQVIEAALSIENATLSNSSNANALTVNGGITGTSASDMTLTLSGGGTGGIVLTGDISDGGVGGMLALDVDADNTVITLSGNNTFSGGFGATDTPNFYTVIAGSNMAFGTGTIFSQGIRFEAGASGLDLGNNVVVGASPSSSDGSGGFRVDGNESLTFSGTISQDGGRTFENTGTGTVTFSGTFELGSNQANLTDGNWNITGVVTGNGSSSLSSGGSGTTITLSGANTYTGETRITAGTVVADRADNGAVDGALGVGGNIEFTGGTLRYTPNSASTDYSTRIVNSTSAISLDTSGQNVTLASAIGSSNTGGLTKLGTGILTLSGANTYTGQTTVGNGTLTLGSAAGIPDGGAVEVQSGASLDLNGNTKSLGSVSGSGTISGNGGTLTVGASGGVFAPGESGIGQLSVDGDLTFDTSGSAVFEYDGNAGAGASGGFDQLLVTGANRTVTLGGNFFLQPSTEITSAYTIIDLDDATSMFNGTVFANVAEGSLAGGGDNFFNFSYTTGTDNNDFGVVAANNVKYWRGGDPAQVGGSITGWQDIANWYTDVDATTQAPAIAGAGDIVVLHTTTAAGGSDDRRDVLQPNDDRTVGSIVVLDGASFDADTANVFIIREGNASTGSTLTLTNSNALQFYSDNSETNRILRFQADESDTNTEAANLLFQTGTGSDVSILVEGSTDSIEIGYDINDAPIDNAARIIKSGAGTLELNGPRANGFTGDYVIEAGTLNLDKADGITAITGDILMSGSRLELEHSNQIADTSTITQTSGTIDISSGKTETIRSLQSSGGIVNFSGSNGNLTLLEDSTVNNVTIGTTGTFTLADNVTLTQVGNTSNLSGNEFIIFNTGTGAVADMAGEQNTGEGDGGIIKLGAGTLRLTNDDSGYGGRTQLEEGVTEITSIKDQGGTSDTTFNSSLGDGDTDPTIQLGADSTAGTLKLIGTGTFNTSNRPFEIGDGGGTIEIDDASQILTLTGVISDNNNSGALTKAGAGTLRLTGTNTYSGGTILSAARTIVGNNSALGSGTVTLNETDSTLEIENGFSIANNLVVSDTGDAKILTVSTGGTAAYSGNIETQETGTNGDATRGNFEVNADSASQLTLSGVISGVGNLNTTGDGIVTFAGSVANTFSGGFFLGDDTSSTVTPDGLQGVNAGIVEFSRGDAFGTGTLVSRGGQLRATTAGQTITNDIIVSNGGFRLGGDNDFTLSGDIQLVGSSRGIGNYSLEGRRFTFTGNIDLNDATNGRTFTVDGINNADNGEMVFTGDISGPAPFNIGSTFDDGLVIITGTNSYTSTSIPTGTLQVGDGGLTGTLGTGNVTNNSALIFDRAGDYTFSSAVTGSGTVTKNGSGIVRLAGANTYSGTTTINAGALYLEGTPGGNVIVADGAGIGGEGTIGGNLTMGSSTGAQLFVDGATSGALTVQGDTDTSAGVDVVVDNNGAGPFVVLSFNTGASNNIVAGVSGHFTTSATTSGRAGSSASFSIVGSDVLLDLGFATRTWDNDSGDGFWNEGLGSSANWIEGDNLFFDGDLVVFADDAGSNQTVTVSENVAPGQVTFSNDSNTYTIDSSGGSTIDISQGLVVSGNALVTINGELTGTTGTLVKGDSNDGISDGGILALTGPNTYEGGTLLTEATIQIFDSSSLGTGTLTITDDGAGSNATPTLDLDADGLNVANDIVFLNGGNLKRVRIAIPTGNTNGELSGTITIEETSVNHSAFEMGTGEVLTISGQVTGAGGIQKLGVGTLLLTNSANDFRNDLRVGNGIVIVETIGLSGEASQAGAGSRIILGQDSANGTLRYTGAGTTTDRQIQVGIRNSGTNQTGGGTIENNGTGALIFSNSRFGNFNTQQSDTTNVGPRTLTLSGTYTGGINEIQGVLRDNNTTVSAIDETVSLVKAGDSTWRLSGTNTYTGTTAVTGGTLLIDGDQSAASGGVSVSSSATLGGTGTIGGATALDSGAFLTGGTDGTIGTLSFSSGLDASDSTWLVDLAQDVNGSSDLIAVTGNLDISGATLTDQFTGTYTLGNSYTIASYTGDLIGTFSGLGGGEHILGGGLYLIDYGTGTNSTITLTAVPEPGTIGLLALGLLSGFFVRRFRRKAVSEK